MGLSNEERIHKVYYAIKKISDLGKEIGRDKSYREINRYKIIKKKSASLWRTLFQKSRNSGFWLFGSDEKVSMMNTTILSIALYNNIKECDIPPDKDPKALRKSKIDDDKYVFNVFDGFLDMEGLLSSNNRLVYLIYQWCQQIQYAANRYDDDLSKKFLPVLKVIADIMGEIFSLFTEDENFSEAWLILEISKKLYGKESMSYVKSEDLDKVTMFLLDNNLHHDIPGYMRDRSYRIWHLKQILKDLESDSSLKNRVKNMVKVTAKQYGEYNHIKKKLEDLCKKIKFPFKEITPFIDAYLNEKKKEDEISIKRSDEDKKWERDDLLK